jgi:putative DNA primase/helicase
MQSGNNFAFPLTDLGNAERLVSQFGTRIRYTKAKGWLVYDGRRWKRDDKDAVYQFAAATARGLVREFSRISDPDMRTLLASHARKSESSKSIKAMVNLAQTLPRVAIDVRELDSDPWLFNVLNGTLDLRDGKLRKHRPSDLITKLSPVEYDRRAICPLWFQFLERVQASGEVRAFLQRFAGYCLTGVIREHVLPINYGGGRNGKGVFVDTLLYIMGEYAKQIPTELLMVKRGDAHPTDRASLLGCRFAAASETEEGRAMNVALVKQLTGGDRISARFMRQDFFDFDPTHKMMLSTNHQPAIRETQNAIWDRVKLIPWAVTIPEEEQDKELKEKLRAEAPGILRWAVDGCQMWQRQGLNPPEAIRAATNAYRECEDFIAGFIEECCTVEAGARESATDLYAAYKHWTEIGGESLQSQKAFAERLIEKGFERVKSSGYKFYVGIKLKNPAS